MVYGGGGITPDYAVAPLASNDFVDALTGNFVFFTFGRDFLASNPQIDNSFQVTDKVLADFKAHIQKRNINFTEQQFQDNKDVLKRMIKHEIFTIAWVSQMPIRFFSMAIHKF